MTITVRGIGDAPAAVPDAYATDEDLALSVPAPGVLGNDIDPDSDALTVAPATGPANGTLALNADGSFTYTPKPNFSGTDTFGYKARDAGGALSAEATVTIAVRGVNDAPEAVPDIYATDKDVALTVPAPGVLGNDTDPDPGDTRTAERVSGPANGSLTLNADGSFTYTPNPNFSGTDSFTYKARDAAGALSAEAMVTITVGSVNRPPVCSAVRADPSRLSPPDRTMRLVTLSGASDPDGDPVRTTVLGVTQDEPLSGHGHAASDAQRVATTHQVFLRADRSAKGDGRVYRVSFSVTDGTGAACSGVLKIGVPKSQTGPGANPVESPLVVNSFGS